MTNRGAREIARFWIGEGSAQPKAGPGTVQASDLPPKPSIGSDQSWDGGGTVAYMSPEQALGMPLDAAPTFSRLASCCTKWRRDISLSAATHRLPCLIEFLHKAPTAPVRLNPEVPGELERIINKALEKDREMRYQSASDLRTDLRRLKRDTDSGRAAIMTATAESRRRPVWKLLLERRRTLALAAAVALLVASALIWKWTAGFHDKSPMPVTPKSVSEEQPSIVVLPFDDISPKHDNEYFAVGLAEEIRGDLSHIRALRVISKKTAEAIKETRKGLHTIAEEVKVRYVLEGSVRRAETVSASARSSSTP